MPVPDLPPLRDYSRSRAVLIGTWDYTFLEPVPAAAHSLRRIAGLLTGPLCGWPSDRVLVMGNEPGPGDIPDRLITAYNGVDVALFYFAGHGQIAADNQLCLGLTQSRPEWNRRAATSLRFADVRQALLESRAATKIVILDCCFAGLATTEVLGAAGDVLELTSGTGAYTMAATSAFGAAWYENTRRLSRPQTYFTKYLADLVERGMPGQPSRLRLDPLFKQVRENLAADGRPVPDSRAVNDAREFVFAYNAAPPQMQHDPEQELAQRDAQVAALRDQVAAHVRERARLQARLAELSPAAAESREELREAIDEAEREAGEAGRRLDEARDAAAAVTSVAWPAGLTSDPPVTHRGVRRGVAVRAMLATVLLGGAIAGLVIALPGGNHPRGATSGGPVSTRRPVSTGSPLNVAAVSGALRKSLQLVQPDSVAFAPDGTTLAVGTVSPADAFNPSEPGNAYLVNTSSWSEVPLYDPSSKGVSTVTFGQDDTLATSDVNGEAYAWDIKSLHARPDYPDPQNGIVTAIAGAPKGDVAVIEVSKDIYLWNPATGGIAGPFIDPNTENLAAVAISPDGGTLATADGNRTVYVWNTGDLGAGPDEQSGNSLLNTSVTSLAVAPGGDAVAIAGGENAYLWDPVSGKLTTLTSPSGNSVTSVAFSPSGDLLAVGDSNGKTSLWDVVAPHGTPLAAVSDPAPKSVASVAFGPDGTTLATADRDGYVYLWRLTIKSG